MTNNNAPQVNASNPLGTLLVVCVALFFGVLNASAVGIALPLIAGDLSIGPGKLTWLMTSFLLMVSPFLSMAACPTFTARGGCSCWG